LSLGVESRGRALFVTGAHDFEEALGFWSRDYLLQVMRGPGTPWQKLHNARRRLDTLIFSEIDTRRATGERRRPRGARI